MQTKKQKAKKYIGKTYARNNFASIISEVVGGQVFYLTDRGEPEVAIVPVKVIEDIGKKKKIESFKKSDVFGMWKNREDMKDPVEWVRNKRRERFNRIYEKTNSN